jgi:hypothetical protein
MSHAVQDELRRLHVSDRIRVAANLVDDVNVARVPRVPALVQAVELLAGIIQILTSEIARDHSNSGGGGPYPNSR